MIHQRHRTIQESQWLLCKAEGFTLIEVALAVTIVGMLAVLAVPNYLEFVEKARVARAISELHGLAKDIHGFALGVGQYPDSLAQIARGTLLDPWGTPYEYWRVKCGPVDDISNLARLQWQRQKNPRVTPAVNSHRVDRDNHVVFAVDDGNRRDHIFLVQGNGGGGGNGNGGGGGNGNGGGGQNCGQGGARKDRHLHPISSDFDLYSMGKDRDSVKPLTAQKSHDDVIRASDGGYYGLARNF